MASIFQLRNHVTTGLMVIAVACLVFLFTSCQNSYGEKLEYNKGELYYTKNTTKAEAEKLGNYLNGEKFFDQDRRITVQLDKGTNDTLLFRLVVLDSFVNKPEYAELWSSISDELSQKVFDNKPVLIHFCDKYLVTKKVIVAASTMAGNKEESHS